MILEMHRKHVTANALRIFQLGTMDYRKALEFQKTMHSEVLNGANNVLIFVEHPPVYTLGKNATKENLRTQVADVEIIQTDRGGDITFHGPEQIVVYPIVDLRGKSIREFVHYLEEIVIQTLAQFGVLAHCNEKYPGVWIGMEKVCAIGIRIKQGVSMHGLALNVNTDLSYFTRIIPCGISGFGVTSMEKILGRKVEINAVVDEMCVQFTQQSKKSAELI